MSKKAKLLRFNTTVSKEEADKIPISNKVDYDAIKKNDDNVVEIVAKIPVSTSKRKWNYTEEAIKNVVADVNDGNINGFKGHLKPEDISNKFPKIAMHWVGASYKEDEKTAYVRGIVDESEKDLKRWIGANRINQVSIFGKPTLKRNNNGQVDVVNYETYSIDITPLGRAGMPTKILKVASGEMDNIDYDSFDFNDYIGELDGSYEELNNALSEAVRNYFGTNENKYIFIKKTFPTYAIVKVEEYMSGKNNDKLYKIEYNEKDDIINIIKSEEVREIISYELISSGEMNDEGGKNMSKIEIEKSEFEKLKQTIGSLETEVKKYKLDEEQKTHGEMVKKCINEKITNPKIKQLVQTTTNFKGKTYELINGEIDEILKLDIFKEFINDSSIKPLIGNKPNENENEVEGFKTFKTSI